MYSERNRNIRSLGYANYDAYLSGSQWRQIRESVLERDKRRCVCCQGDATQVHHRSYSLDVLAGRDLSKDAMVSICRTCHNSIEYNGDVKRSIDEANAKLDGFTSIKQMPDVEMKAPPCRGDKERNRSEARRKSGRIPGNFCPTCTVNRATGQFGRPERRCVDCRIKEEENRCKLVSAGCP